MMMKMKGLEEDGGMIRRKVERDMVNGLGGRFDNMVGCWGWRCKGDFREKRMSSQLKGEMRMG
ncbi:hypothetical protein, partial [Paenibacillus xylanexedens]|uniref:hypothetical protein n=1 Tax=Paenibacillus xylanexedens TaxID=528191 RepID=UPI001C92C15F